MSLFSLALPSTNFVFTSSCLADIISPGGEPAITETSWYSASGSLAYAFGRATNSPVAINATKLLPEDVDGVESKSLMSTLWTTAPIAPTNPYRRVNGLTSGNHGVVFIFPRGLVIGQNNSFGWWLTGTGTGTGIVSFQTSE